MKSKCDKFTNQYCLLRNPSLKTTRGLHHKHKVVSHHAIIILHFTYFFFHMLLTQVAEELMKVPKSQK